MATSKPRVLLLVSGAAPNSLVGSAVATQKDIWPTTRTGRAGQGVQVEEVVGVAGVWTNYQNIIGIETAIKSDSGIEFRRYLSVRCRAQSWCCCSHHFSSQ